MGINFRILIKPSAKNCTREGKLPFYRKKPLQNQAKMNGVVLFKCLNLAEYIFKCFWKDENVGGKKGQQ